MSEFRIGLKGALDVLQTAYVDGKLNLFSIGFYKINGQYSYKKQVCRADLKNAAKWRDSANDITTARMTKGKMKYSPMLKRTLRLYDTEKSTNFNCKVDLITEFEMNGNKYLLDHQYEL